MTLELPSRFLFVGLDAASPDARTALWSRTLPILLTQAALRAGVPAEARVAARFPDDPERAALVRPIQPLPRPPELGTRTVSGTLRHHDDAWTLVLRCNGQNHPDGPVEIHPPQGALDLARAVLERLALPDTLDGTIPDEEPAASAWLQHLDNTLAHALAGRAAFPRPESRWAHAAEVLRTLPTFQPARHELARAIDDLDVAPELRAAWARVLDPSLQPPDDAHLRLPTDDTLG